MKNKFAVMVTLIGVGLCLGVGSAEANNLKFSGRGETNNWSSGQAAFSTNNEFYIVSADPQKAGAPTVEYLNVTSDTQAGLVQFYTPSNGTVLTLTSASSGATNKVYVASGGAVFGNTAVAVLRHATTDTYEKLIVQGNASATVITLTNATRSAVAIGDTIHLMTLASSLPVASVSLSVPPSREFNVPQGLFTGEPGEPLLVQVTGIGTNSIDLNAISGRFNYAVINGLLVK